MKLKAGDFIVGATDAKGVVYRVDPATGTETVLGSAGCEVSDIAVAVDKNGRIWVSYAESTGYSGGLLRLEPLRGRQRLISWSSFFVEPTAVGIETNGDVLVVDAEAFNKVGGVLRVHPDEVEQKPVTRGGLFNQPLGFSIAPNGLLFVADPAANGGPAIVRVDPKSGTQTNVSSGGELRAPVSVGVATNGDLVVSDAKAFEGHGGVLRIDAKTGEQTKVISGGDFAEPQGLALFGKNRAVVADRAAFNNRGGLIEVDLKDGKQSATWPSQKYFDVRSVAVVPGSQPDLQIKRAFIIFGYAGNGFHNDSGDRQARVQSGNMGTTRTYYVRLRNEGPFTDSFVMRGIGSVPGLTVRYFAGTSHNDEITTAIVAGRHAIRNLAPGDKAFVRVDVTVDSQSSSGSKQIVFVGAVSLTDPSKKDVVQAVMEVD